MLLEKLNQIRNICAGLNWGSLPNPFKLIDELSLEIVELEKKKAALEAKLSVLEKNKNQNENNKK